jgi:peptide-methionine (S)-S-oxide reductase
MDKLLEMPTANTALPGRTETLVTDEFHEVLKNPLKGPYPPGYEIATFAMGCFWGVERLFWRQRDVWVTAVGYTGGFTPNPTYEEVCTGRTGHAEAVRVVYKSGRGAYAELLKHFWENHNPTQGMQQGNDIGTQYRSAIFYHSNAQKSTAERAMKIYKRAYLEKNAGSITTCIVPASEFYYAEDYHQGYLVKNPAGYCGLSATGICCDIPSA